MKRSIVAIIMLMLLLCSCGTQDTSAGAASAQDGPTPAEDVDAGADASPGILSSFTADTLDGGQADETLFAGYDVTMINVWGTFCGPCINEMPDLGELAEEYADQGVRIVGFVADVLDSDGQFSESQLETAREIVETTGAGYTHLLPSPDLQGLLSQISSLPTTFFVDSTGAQTGNAYIGSRSKEEWSAILDELLSEAGA